MTYLKRVFFFFFKLRHQQIFFFFTIISFFDSVNRKCWENTQNRKRFYFSTISVWLEWWKSERVINKYKFLLFNWKKKKGYKWLFSRMSYFYIMKTEFIEGENIILVLTFWSYDQFSLYILIIVNLASIIFNL